MGVCMKFARLSVISLLLCLPLGHAQAERVPQVRGVSDPEFAASLAAVLAPVPDAETLFEARRQSRRAAEVLRNYLNSLGYFKAQVRPGADNLLPTLDVATGPQFRLGAVSVALLGAPLSLSPMPVSGELALPSVIVGGGDQLLVDARERGYPDAELIRTRVIGDEAAARVDVVYELSPGPQVRLGEVIFDADFPISLSARQALIPFQPGALYDPGQLSAIEQRLASTRLFSVYAASLEDSTTERRNVRVTTTPRARYTLSSGVSFATDEGPGLTLEWTVRNPTGRGDTLVINPSVSADQQALALDWTWPNAFGFARSLAFNGLIEKEKTDAYERTAQSVGATVSLRATPRLTYTLGGAIERAQETDTDGARDLQVFSGSAGFRFDAADSLLNPASGWRVEARLEPGLITGDSSGEFVRTQVDLSGYLPLDDARRWVGAALLGAGAVLADEALRLPASRRFFAGGGGSARGYAYQSIGPTTDGAPSGGRSLVRTALELRHRHSDTIGSVIFVDAASVGERWHELGSDHRVGAGVGLRYFTAIGPLRVDLGVPVDARPGDDPFQLYLSIGQAF